MGADAQQSYGTGRARILEAARAIFSERGYRGSTTRDIAARAALTEPMVFRYFGSKAALFEEAAITPVVGFIDEYVAEWAGRERGAWDAEVEALDFFTRLYEVLSADRDLLMAVLSAGEFIDELDEASKRLDAAFGRVVKMFEAVVEEEFEARGLTEPDRPALSRVMLGMVLAFAMHPDWLKIGGRRGGVPIDRVLAEAARTVVDGVGPST